MRKYVLGSLAAVMVVASAGATNAAISYTFDTDSKGANENKLTKSFHLLTSCRIDFCEDNGAYKNPFWKGKK